MNPYIKLIVLGVVILVIGGCVATTSRVYQSPDALPPGLESALVIMPSDVIISRFNAGGNAEPRADWSDTVSVNLNEALQDHLYARGIQFMPYGAELRDEDVDFIRQTNVLLDAIELSQLKKTIDGGRDYVVGKSERERLRENNADYALLIVLRANRATGGRKAIAILGALAGATVETNSTKFRSALIDLRDGRVKWANFDDQAISEIGDPLSASKARWVTSIDHLLSDFPL